MSGSAGSARGGAVTEAVEDRLRRLEAQVEALTEAVEVLARGLEDGPMAEPGGGGAGQAARRTHELLLLARTARTAGPPRPRS